VQFLFQDHLLDTDRRELSREQVPVSVEPQVFDLVVHLMENRDRVVSKDELIDKIWHGRSVSESTLTAGSTRRARRSATMARTRR
jgi:DNA-binding winged helix-turn-helix (wHTH) protein